MDTDCERSPGIPRGTRNLKGESPKEDQNDTGVFIMGLCDLNRQLKDTGNKV